MRKTLGLLATLVFALPLTAHAQTVRAGAGGKADTQGASASAAAKGGGGAAAPPGAAATPEDEWAIRDRKLNEAATLTGGVGLLHTQHAQGGAPGQFRLGFTTEMFSSKFLCTSDVPCPNPRGAGNVVQDSHNHVGARLGLAVQITNWLEAYLASSAIANSNEANRPSLLQALGDTTIGGKVHGRITRALHVGGALELWLLNGTGGVGLDGDGTSAKFRGIVTGDLRELTKPLPLRFSTNLTYVVDNSGSVVESTEAARGVAAGGTQSVPITRIERYGLGLNRVDHFDIHLGGEAFVAEEKVRPFVEYQIAIPVNRQGYLCRLDNASNDKCLANEKLAPSSLTIGGRFFPWKRGFHALAAVDIGLTGVGNFIEEMRPTPPWMLYLGAGWAFDTKERPPVVVERQVESKAVAKPFGRKIRGFVHEIEKSEGVPDAIVAWGNHPELTSLATGPDGRFVTQELPSGPYTFAVRAEGFKPAECAVTIAGAKAQESPEPASAKGGPGSKPLIPTPVVYPAGGAAVTGDVQVDCALEALPRLGGIVGHVRDADGGGPVAGVVVRLVDVAGKEYTGAADADGSFRFADLPPGEGRLTATVDGYLATFQKFESKPRVDTTVDLSLARRPKNPLVTVGKNELLLKAQVQFATSSAVILPESSGLLGELADALTSNPRIRRVEIQGHTDNTGTADKNRQLSEERAAAVLEWLTAHGISPSRLTSRGFGQAKPIVPNVTAQNRAKNRRVQFIILDQDPADAAAPGASRPLSREAPF